jgi:ABC-type nickel/cobalt efflux system permease component RcnA
MPDAHILSVLMVGLLLGAKHAFDADHVAAILTLASNNPPLRRSCLIGFCWGAGHTAILLLAGLAVLMFKVSISSELARLFEGGVGVMLIGLGCSVAFTAWRDRLHLHSHSHEGGKNHFHLHSHQGGPHHLHLHRFHLEYKSFGIGIVHGLGGSAAVLLLLLPAVPSLMAGLFYILVFGIGSILGMILLAMALSLPFAWSAEKTARTYLFLQGGAALASIALGTTILFKTLV